MKYVWLTIGITFFIVSLAATPAHAKLKLRTQIQKCEAAKKLGARKLSWGKLTVSERNALNQYKREHAKEYRGCYNDGRKYGDISQAELKDLKMQENMSPEAYAEWKLSQSE